MTIDGIIHINLLDSLINDYKKGIEKAKNRPDLIESNEFSIDNLNKIRNTLIELECKIELMRWSR